MRVLLSLLVYATSAVAQTSSPTGDLSLGVGGDGWRAAASYGRTWPTLSGRLALGGMLRMTAYGGGERVYTDRGGEGGALPGTLGLAPRLVGVNLGVIAEVSLLRALRIGMNLDLAGLGLGPIREVDTLRARPPLFSRFLYGAADRGTLNSEFYGALALSPRLELRGGLSHYATGYRVEGVGGAVGHYQRFDDAFFLALRLRSLRR